MRVTALLVWGCVVVVNEGHEYVNGTRGSDIVSSAADVLVTSVAREIRGVYGVFVGLGRCGM